MNKRVVAVFDFDGTLTTKDTFIEFIKFTHGSVRLFWGILLYSPILLLMKLQLYPNWKAKEKVFAHFYKGKSYDWFVNEGKLFAKQIDYFKSEVIIGELVNHIKKGDTVYVITASIEEWVRPWCNQYSIKDVLGTKVEIVNGIITGSFISKNCYGQEKKNRLQTIEQSRNEYLLYAYGDSKGDKELLNYADYGFLLNHHYKL